MRKKSIALAAATALALGIAVPPSALAAPKVISVSKTCAANTYIAVNTAEWESRMPKPTSEDLRLSFAEPADVKSGKLKPCFIAPRSTGKVPKGIKVNIAAVRKSEPFRLAILAAQPGKTYSFDLVPALFVGGPSYRVTLVGK